VSVVIPHVKGESHLRACLRALENDGCGPKEIVVVDNASADGSVEFIAREFPRVRILRLDRNLGFSGGCNAGIRATRGPFVVLLNDDAVVTPLWLPPLLELVEADPTIAAVQPKIRSLVDPAHFDYAGAAGGLMDVLGYPLARGRIFFTREADSGQYDQPCDIFWATGTCTLLRRDALDAVGDLDETFFAHMEEIDLDWRFHMSGRRVVYAPGSVVMHSAGTTLPPESPRKIYLNHRNGLMMVLKNYSAGTLLWVLPARLLLEVISAAYFLARRDLVQARTILAALGGAAAEGRYLRTARRRSQAVRRVSDLAVMQRMYRGSVVWQYFVRRRRTYEEIAGRRSPAPWPGRLSNAACPLCDSRRIFGHLEVRDRLGPAAAPPYVLGRCGECRHVFLPNGAVDRSQSPDGPARHLPLPPLGDGRSVAGTLYRTARWANVAWKRRQVERLSGSRGRLLDVGCGTGEFLREMRRAGWTVEGVESDERAARHARGRHGLEVMCGDIHAVGRPNGSFDVVTLWHVLEHVANPRRVLAFIRGVLRPRGLAVIAVPNVESIDAAVYGSDWNAYDAPRHLHHFSFEVLDRVCRDAGLELVRRRSLPADAAYNAFSSEALRWRRRGTGLVGRGAGVGRAAFVSARSLVADAPFRRGSVPFSGSTLLTFWVRP
jgi:GT2 family glycosyltransferase/SAM-dependent methyltransferase